MLILRRYKIVLFFTAFAVAFLLTIIFSLSTLAANPGQGSANSQGPANASQTAIQNANEHSVLAPKGVGTLQIRVLDLISKAPLSEVTVEVDGQTATTSNNGGATFVGITEGRQVVRASLSGYVTNMESAKILPNTTTSIKVFLRTVGFSTVIDPSTTNTLTTDQDGDGAPDIEITFPAGAFATSAPVTVSITGGDPTKAQDRDLFPGNFLANENTNPVMLESVYFAEISAAANGTTLTTLAAPAEVCFKVPSALTAAYPVGSKIPVYSFDPTLGTWVKEGKSTVEQANAGSRACFTVNHLSWWNVDQPIETHTTIWGVLLDPESKPLANTYVSAEGVSYAGTSNATTDSSGIFCIEVKRGGETVKVRVGWDHYYGTVSPSTEPQMPTSDAAAAVIVTTPSTQATCPTKVKYVGVLKFPKLEAREVGFMDDHGDKFVANLSTASTYTVTDPVWVKDTSGAVTKNVPVVYKRGIPFKLKDTKFKSDRAITVPLTVAIRGDGNDAYDYDTAGSVTGEWLILNGIAAQAATDKVALLEPYKIDWKYTYDGWTEYSAGASDHRVYVTLRKPNPLKISVPAALNDMLILDIVDYAVRPAVGAEHPDIVMEKIFGRLGNLTAAGVPASGAVTQKILDPITGALTNGAVMTYYIPGGIRVSCPTFGNPPSMFFDAAGAGRCGDWAYFLSELLAIHGIGSELIGFVVDVPAVTTGTPGATCVLDDQYTFNVKNWTFNAPGTSGDPTFPYERNIFAMPAKIEFVDGAGVAGQGNADPPGWFWDHAINRYGGKYYDASYGIGPYNTLNDYENAALDGFPKLNPPGATDAGAMNIQKGFGKQNNTAVQEVCVDFTATFPASPLDLPETLLPPPPPLNFPDIIDIIRDIFNYFSGGN